MATFKLHCVFINGLGPFRKCFKRSHVPDVSTGKKKSETGDRAKEDLKYLKRKKGENKFCG